MSNNYINIEAVYRITTPMFCGGADKNTAELRLPSFKGALRFWWRSMMCGKKISKEELHEKEAALFGSSDQKVGQSKVIMQLIDEDLLESLTSTTAFKGEQFGGLRYFGRGVMDHRGKLSSAMIPGGNFTVRLRISPVLTKDQIEEVQKALIFLGTVGGLGSKSRKGFGSLTLTSLKTDGELHELDSDPIVRIRKLFKDGELTTEQPEWTAWSNKSRLLTVENDSNAGSNGALFLLNELGREQVYYRSWGRNGRVLDKGRENNFTEDHDLSKGLPVTIKYPKRVVFGLPHSYQTGSVEPADKKITRRASPLFIHIHQTDDDSLPVGVISFLPSRFLPGKEEIKSFRNKIITLNTNKAFWNPIHGYLDRLMGKEGATSKKSNLQDAKEVSLV